MICIYNVDCEYLNGISTGGAVLVGVSALLLVDQVMTPQPNGLAADLRREPHFTMLPAPLSTVAHRPLK